MQSLEKSSALFNASQQRIPGGVNSPVRAFNAVGGTPRFFKEALGSVLTDEDNNEYLDYIGSWGPMLFGHSHPNIVEAVRSQAEKAMSFGAPTDLELQMAEHICRMVPSIEMVRMVNSGTEANMSAIRLARAYTNREYIIKFEGCYHGHGDAFLAKAGSGIATLGIPTTPGVPADATRTTLNARYNDTQSVADLFAAYPDKIAGVILEPVVGNMGCVIPQGTFLLDIKKLCEANGALLIFDEVMTGFRLAKGGAQELFAVTPHITTLGKIIGAGLPVGAYGASKEIMNTVAPVGQMYQAGTLSGNPLAMAAGCAMMNLIEQTPDLYEKLKRDGDILSATVLKHSREKNYPVVHQHVGSMGTLFFTNEPVHSWDESSKIDTTAYSKFFHSLLDQGIYFPPAAFEAYFHSYAHTDEQVQATGKAMRNALDEVFESKE